MMRKKKKTERVSLDLPKNLKYEFRLACAKDGKQMSKVLISFVLNYLRRKNQDEKPDAKVSVA